MAWRGRAAGEAENERNEMREIGGPHLRVGGPLGGLRAADPGPRRLDVRRRQQSALVRLRVLRAVRRAAAAVHHVVAVLVRPS